MRAEKALLKDGPIRAQRNLYVEKRQNECPAKGLNSFSMSEWEVYTEIEGIVGIQRYELF